MVIYTTLHGVGRMWWSSWLRHCATSRKVKGSIPDGVTGIFHWLWPHHGPGIDSASNRNEYQEFSWEVEVAGVKSWQPYYLHVPTVLKPRNLNLLEPSGPVQELLYLFFPFTYMAKHSRRWHFISTAVRTSNLVCIGFTWKWCHKHTGMLKVIKTCWVQ